MELIERLTKLLLEGHKKFLFYDHIAEFLIANDVVQVVRCKDCKWAEHGKNYEPYCNHWISGLYANVKDDDFCSYGERKDNDK